MKIIDNSKTFIIAEIGVNHNGDIDLAKKLILKAKECKVDAVKFQTFKAENLVTKDTQKADYQKQNSEEDTQFEMLKNLELSKEDFKILKDFTLENDLIFLSSPFDLESVDLLEDLDIPVYKLGSGELNNFELIKYIESKNKPLILSSGMATLEEIKETVQQIKNKDNLILLHCITGYPSDIKDANLNFIKTLQTEFNIPIGFSDHSPGIELPIAAAALGAKVIEKHFTIDKQLPGPDHGASLDYNEFKEMVKAIRNVELAMGDGIRKLNQKEMDIKEVARKSIILNKDIKKGTILTKDMLIIKRPGTGLAPKEIDNVIGKTTNKDLKRDDILKWDDLL